MAYRAPPSPQLRHDTASLRVVAPAVQETRTGRPQYLKIGEMVDKLLLARVAAVALKVSAAHDHTLVLYMYLFIREVYLYDKARVAAAALMVSAAHTLYNRSVCVCCVRAAHSHVLASRLVFWRVSAAAAGA
jgi:hypothetical protein